MQILSNTNIDFLGKRKIAAVFSIVVILAGLVSLLMHGGPRLSIDFRGGTVVELRITPAPDISEVRAALDAAGVGVQNVQEFGEPEEFLIYLDASATRGIDESQPTVAQVVADAMSTYTVEERRVETVGPKIGDELKTAAIQSIIVALALIILYIAVRFVWFYGLAAVLALVHDVLITLGVFSLIDKEISLTILAAFLTIIGYSLNDTIVVFDRIRENLGKRRREPYREIFNRSINETLSRTLITSITTMLTAVILFVFGGAVIHDFAFALIVGVLIGTYSSIFVASPALVAFYERRSKDRKRVAKGNGAKGARAPKAVA